jgi:hypothetical protein
MHDENKRYFENILSQLLEFHGGNISLDDNAKELYDKSDEKYDKILKSFPKKDDSHWRSFMGKLSGLLPRLLCVMHALTQIENDQPIGGKISLETTQRTIYLIDDFFIPHAETIYRDAGAEIPNQETEGLTFNHDEKKVIRFLATHVKNGVYKISKRDLIRKSRTFAELKRKKMADPLLDMLIISGIISIEKTSNGTELIGISEYVTELAEDC